MIGFLQFDVNGLAWLLARFSQAELGFRLTLFFPGGAFGSHGKDQSDEHCNEGFLWEQHNVDETSLSIGYHGALTKSIPRWLLLGEQGEGL